jgi:hypothetical protein
MKASLDSHNKANILLTKEDAQQLKDCGELEGKIYRTDKGDMPIKLKVSENGWRAEGVPPDVGYEDKKAYEIDIPPQGPAEILDGRVIGTDMTVVRLRKVYVALSEAFWRG